MIEPLDAWQITYFTHDIRRAARAYHRLYGCAPFFVADHVKLKRSVYRGIEDTTPLDYGVALAQWGGVTVQFVQQNVSGRSVFHDLYPEGTLQTGIHNIALCVDDLNETIAHFNAAGHETALYAEIESAYSFAVVDTVFVYGHFTALYPRGSFLSGVHAMLTDATRDYDGGDLFRDIDPVDFGV